MGRTIHGKRTKGGSTAKLTNNLRYPVHVSDEVQWMGDKHGSR